MSSTANPSQLVLPLRSRVTCPHCWNEFPPDRALWIAQHPDLVGDPRLGADQPQRFLPTRFNVQGAAIDSRGFACHGLACPKCHLAVPRLMFEMQTMFLSILGSPASGKSYFLAAMTWRLRSVLPKYFAVGFNDADPALNHRLHEYESLQFLNPNQEALVAIEKTEVQGDLLRHGALRRSGRQLSAALRLLALAFGGASQSSLFRQGGPIDLRLRQRGREFLAGRRHGDEPRYPALGPVAGPDVPLRSDAGHALPQALQRQDGRSPDDGASGTLQRERAVRQDTVLSEAAQRVRRYTGLAQSQKHERPLIVVVTKFDSWRHLLAGATLPAVRVATPLNNHSAVNLEGIEERFQAGPGRFSGRFPRRSSRRPRVSLPRCCTSRSVPRVAGRRPIPRRALSVSGPRT